MKISDEAVEAARGAHTAAWRDSLKGIPAEPMRAALEAAAPYLEPAGRPLGISADEWHRCTNLESHQPHTWVYESAAFVCDGGAPAGDGGLREALEKLIGEWDRLPCVSGYKIPNDADDDSQCLSCAAVDLRSLLAAHPSAAPAVPQPADEAIPESTSRPVDREALWEAVVKVRDASPRVPNDADSWDIVDAVLAVLAGEQADALFAAGVVRSEAEVKAEALRQATEVLTEAWQESRPEHQAGLFVAIRKLRECANELEGKR